MFRWITKEQAKRAAENYRRAVRQGEAMRWLAEFDWLLAPLWEYMHGRTRDIDRERDVMRRRLESYNAKQLPEQQHKQLLVIAQKLGTLHERIQVNSVGQQTNASREEYQRLYGALNEVRILLGDVICDKVRN